MSAIASTSSESGTEPTPRATVTATVLQPLVICLVEAGYDASDLLRSFGLEPADLQNPACRIPEDHLRGIWQQALGASGDPALGIRAGQKAEPKALGVLGYVIANAASVGQALRLWDRFNRLIFDLPLWLMRPLDAQSTALIMRNRDDVDVELQRPLVEFAFASLHRIASVLAARQPASSGFLLRLEFRHHAPQAEVLTAYREAFGDVPVLFDRDETMLVFEPAALAQPVAYADEQMLLLMQRRADQELRALATEADIVVRMKAVIRRRLVGRTPTLSKVAADCNMSRATLQRRLAKAGTGFQRLLDEVRYTTARELLAEPEMSVEEAGFILGYAEPAAFQHAFRRWAGRPPGEFRREALSRAG